MKENPPSLEEIYEKYEKRCGKRKKNTDQKKRTNLNKKKRKRGGERKSQRNQKSDNGARGKSFRLTGEPRRNPVGGGERRETEAEEEEGVRGRKTPEEKIEVGVEKKA